MPQQCLLIARMIAIDLLRGDTRTTGTLTLAAPTIAPRITTEQRGAYQPPEAAPAAALIIMIMQVGDTPGHSAPLQAFITTASTLGSAGAPIRVPHGHRAALRDHLAAMHEDKLCWHHGHALSTVLQSPQALPRWPRDQQTPPLKTEVRAMVTGAHKAKRFTWPDAWPSPLKPWRSSMLPPPPQVPLHTT